MTDTVQNELLPCPYKEFFNIIWEQYCDHCFDLDGAETILQAGLGLGLLREEQYSEAVHSPDYSERWDYEEGDPIYFKANSTIPAALPVGDEKKHNWKIGDKFSLNGFNGEIYKTDEHGWVWAFDLKTKENGFDFHPHTMVKAEPILTIEDENKTFSYYARANNLINVGTDGMATCVQDLNKRRIDFLSGYKASRADTTQVILKLESALHAYVTYHSGHNMDGTLRVIQKNGREALAALHPETKEK